MVTSLVAAESLLLVLLTVFVVALLRSHAEILRRLETLDPSHNPALCAHLQPLYIFCMQHLLKANLEQDPQKLGELIRILTPLRDAWSTTVAQIAAANK